ncbi:MAG: PKD domain-containing protein, partial [Bacteroidota bacterium]
WNWDFGDGFSSNLQNPTHTFPGGGTYDVCLTITSDCGTDQSCRTIDLGCGVPTAAFGSNASSLTLDFTDLSFGDPQTWSWDFGDGTNSDEQNPSHTYDQPGNYQVCLTVTNSCETNTSCTLLNVNCTSVAANFNEQISGLTILLTGNADPIADTYNWTFGDGSIGQGQFLNHTYQAPGTYQVCLTVNGPCGLDTYCENISVACAPANSGFAFNTNELNVSFTGNQEAGLSHLWQFANQGTAMVANPNFSFPGPGTYQVCYTATNDCGGTTTCELVQVSCPIPNSGFNFSSDLLNYSFFGPNIDAGGTYSWTFGDGSSSNAANPQHTYTSPGLYQACLTTQNVCGTSTTCQTFNVVCPTPSSVFSSSLADLTLSLSASTNASDTYDWSFGDGTTGQGQNIDHDYDQPGNYQVCLTVSNSCGQVSNCQFIAVSCAPPQADFTLAEDNYEYQFFGPMPNLDATYSWTFGDGGTSEEQTPMHTYDLLGT